MEDLKLFLDKTTLQDSPLGPSSLSQPLSHFMHLIGNGTEDGIDLGLPLYQVGLGLGPTIQYKMFIIHWIFIKYDPRSFLGKILGPVLNGPGGIKNGPGGIKVLS
jgi:hypothetical protein